MNIYMKTKKRGRKEERRHRDNVTGVHDPCINRDHSIFI